MTTATLDTQLKPGQRVTIDEEVEGVFIGELPEGDIFRRFRGEGYRFAYEGVSKDSSKTPYVVEMKTQKRTTTIIGNNVSLNREPINLFFYYHTDKRFLELHRLIRGAA